jgi:integrase
MPRRANAPRLWLRPARHNAAGTLTHAASFFILDRGRQIATGTSESVQAEKKLAAYIGQKHSERIAHGKREIDQIPIADVINVYAADIVPNRVRPDQAAFRLNRLLEFFGDKTLVDLNGRLCRNYTKQSATDAMARRDLEDLRAAINHHRREGLHDRIVSVVMPDRRPPREKWLTREDAAKLLWTLWRRGKCRHVARFVLIALYTGRRAAVVCGASFKRSQGRTWLDTRAGFLWPPERARVTKKRNPPIPLPARLVAHLRRWERQGWAYPVQWGDHSVTRVDKTVKDAASEAGLGYVTPHVLRHTAATWQMQAATDIFEASKYLGMTIRTLETVYAHHRPDHLTGARDAYDRHRQRFANEIGEPKANVTRNNQTKTLKKSAR